MKWEYASFVVGITLALVTPDKRGLKCAAVVANIVHHARVSVEPGHRGSTFDGQHLWCVGIRCVRIAGAGQNANLNRVIKTESHNCLLINA